MRPTFLFTYQIALKLALLFYTFSFCHLSLAKALPHSIMATEQQIQIQQQVQQDLATQAFHRQVTEPLHLHQSIQTNSIQPTSQTKTACFTIQHIHIVDWQPNTPLAQLPISRFAQTFQRIVPSLSLHFPFCLDTTLLKQIQHGFQNRLIKQGWITSQVHIPNQDLTQQVLYLVVLPGTLKDILWQSKSVIPHAYGLMAQSAFPLTKGQLLNLRQLEQGLENLRMGGRAEADIEILPAQGNQAKEGESDILVKYQQPFPLRFQFGIDDAGDKEFGHWQPRASVFLDNLFSFNELAYISTTRSIKGKQDMPGKRYTHNLTFGFSIPWQYWRLEGMYSRYHDYRTVFGPFLNYAYQGYNQQLSLSLSRLIFRDEKQKILLTGSVWRFKSKMKINTISLDSQYHRLGGWEVDYQHILFVGRNTLSLNLHYKQGTGAFHAFSDQQAHYEKGTNRPKIWTAQLNWVQPFILNKLSFYWDTSLLAQYAQTPLIEQHLFNLGGRYTVRGFDGKHLLKGKNGILWKQDIGWFYQPTHQLYIGLDSGYIHNSQPIYQPNHWLVGWTFGLKGQIFSSQNPRFYYTIFLGSSLKKPQALKTDKLPYGVSLSYQF